MISLLPSLPGVRESFGIDTLLPAGERASVHVAIVVLGALLLFLSIQIARGKRTAWWVALVLLLASAVAHLLKGPDPIAIAVDLAGVAGLLAGPPRLHRGARPAQPDLDRPLHRALPPRRRRLRLRLALRGAQPPLARPHGRRRARDDLQGPRRPRRAIHLRERPLRQVLRRRAARARHPRRRGPALARLPPVRRPRRRQRRGPPAARTSSSAPGATTPSPTSPARGQAVLLLLRRRGDGRLRLHPRLRARLRRPDRQPGVDRPRARRVPRPLPRTRAGASPSSPCARRTSTSTSHAASTASTSATRRSSIAASSPSRGRG